MSKKIGILTWYKVINHGAILQAFALQETMKSLGCNVIELDYNRNYKIYNYTKLDRIISAFKKLNLNKIKIKLHIKKWNNEKKEKFEEFKKNKLNIGKMYNDSSNDIDIAIIGSDMVFDFYEGYNPFMYGKDVKAKHVCSYAASIGYTTKSLFENFENKDEIIELLLKMDKISYRDDNTGKILEECCRIKGTKVIDPVLLYGFNEERIKWDKNGWKNEKYILIYSYDYNMNKREEVKSIKRFAKENNLKIISVGYYHPWCDKIVNADPCEFIELFNNAQYIVTDTFHGTVFSLTFGKQFCVKVRNNSFKVIDLLNDLKINSESNENIYDKLQKLKKQPLNYDNINQEILKLREKSKNYLMQIIKE